MRVHENVLAAGFVLIAFSLFLLKGLHGIPGAVGLVGAERVLAGEVPYRDFWTMYAPGEFYLLAFLFAVFGTQAIVSSIAGSLFSALAVGLVCRLVGRATGHWGYALAAAALFTAGFLGNGRFGSVSSYTVGIVCVLIALNQLQRYFELDRNAPLIGAGLAIGVAAIFKHDVAGYTALAMLAGVTVFRLLSTGSTPRRGVVRDPVIFGLAAALPVLPVVAILAVVAGYDAFWDTIWFPATIFPDVRPESYPSLLPTGLYDPWKIQLLLNWGRYAYFALPLLVWLAALPAIALAVRRRDGKTAALGVTLAITFLFHFYAAHVQINTHIISMTFYAACLGAVILHDLAARRRQSMGAALRGFAAIVACLWVAALAAQPVFDVVIARQPAMAALPPPKMSTVYMQRDRAEEYTGLTDYVRQHVPPGQPIYVGLRRHDVIITSHPAVYFMVDRPAATRYHELHGGVADTAPMQAEIIRDLKEKDVHLLVLLDPFPDDVLDRGKEMIRRKQPQVGATMLDAFIRANYAPARRFSVYEVWLKKPAANSGGAR